MRLPGRQATVQQFLVDGAEHCRAQHGEVGRHPIPARPGIGQQIAQRRPPVRVGEPQLVHRQVSRWAVLEQAARPGRHTPLGAAAGHRRPQCGHPVPQPGGPVTGYARAGERAGQAVQRVLVILRVAANRQQPAGLGVPDEQRAQHDEQGLLVGPVQLRGRPRARPGGDRLPQPRHDGPELLPQVPPGIGQPGRSRPRLTRHPGAGAARRRLTATRIQIVAAAWPRTIRQPPAALDGGRGRITRGLRPSHRKGRHVIGLPPDVWAGRVPDPAAGMRPGSPAAVLGFEGGRITRGPRPGHRKGRHVIGLPPDVWAARVPGPAAGLRPVGSAAAAVLGFEGGKRITLVTQAQDPACRASVLARPRWPPRPRRWGRPGRAGRAHSAGSAAKSRSLRRWPREG